MASRFQSTLAPERQAELLVEFISVRGDRLSLAAARSLVDSLHAGDDRAVADALKKTLAAHGVKLKHTNALALAAKLAGRAGYHDKRYGCAAPFTAVYSMASVETYDFDSLHAAEEWVFKRVAAWVHAQSQPFIITVLRDRAKLMLEAENQPPFTAIYVQIADAQADWDKRSPQFVERVRRLVEYGGKGFLNGYVSARFGKADLSRSADLVVSVDEAELGRGTELAVYAALEFISEGELSLTPLTEGRLRVGDSEVLLSLEYASFGSSEIKSASSELTESQVASFSTRYQRFKTLFESPKRASPSTVNGLIRPGQPSNPPELELDVPAVFAQLLRLDKNTEWLSERTGIEQSALVGPLKLGEVLRVAELVSSDDYNRVVRKATKPSSVYATKPLLRAALLEADEFRIVMPMGMDDEAMAAVQRAGKELSDSRQVFRMVQSGTLPGDFDITIFSSDADQFIDSVNALGLTTRFAFETMLSSDSGAGGPAIGRRLVFFVEAQPVTGRQA